MAIMNIAGEAFNVLVEGDETKPVLMISNPLGMTLRVWDGVMPALLEHFRVVRTDARGHGASVADEGPYSIERLGRDAVAILDTLGIETAHWLGLSKGGAVGMWVLAYAPERITRAVLANTAARIAGPDVWNERIRFAREAGMDAVAEAAAERWFTRGFRDTRPEEVEAVLAMVRATPLQGYVATCAALRDMDLREAIRSVRAPVLVIVGRHDPSTPPEAGASVASSIAGAKLVTLETSHMSCIEDPVGFSEAVIGFLTASERAEAAAPPRRRAAGRKAPQRAPTVRKGAARKAVVAKAVVPKAAAKKVPAPKAATEKAPTKAAAVKKAPAKKSTAKTSALGAATAKLVPAKKVAAKKAAAKQAPSKPASAKKAITETPAAKKIAAKKPSTKAATGKSAVKKAPAKKPGGRKKT